LGSFTTRLEREYTPLVLPTKCGTGSLSAQKSRTGENRADPPIYSRILSETEVLFYPSQSPEGSLAPPIEPNATSLITDTALTVPQSSMKTKICLEPDSIWLKRIIHPSIVLILGKRGSGKSALAYYLLEINRYGPNLM